MSEQRKVPKLRFPEFTDDWEQRKFGDIGAVAMCRRILKHQTSDSGDIPFYKIGTFGGTPDAYISKELFEEFKARYPYPDKGDILISASGSIGRTVEFTGQNEYFQDSNIVWLKHDKSIINPFLRHLYEVVKWASIEGSTIKRLYNDNILKTEIIIPSVQEQTKIAEMLDGIDNHITLHQRKCEVLKKLKKGLLQKMFPKDGTNIPEIRFPEFTDAWEQCKVSEIAETTFGGGTPKTSNDSFWIGNIPWIQSSDLTENILFDVVPKKHISQEAIDKSATKLVPKNSVAIVTRVGVGKLAFMPFSYATSQDFLSLSKLKTEPQFTVYVLYKKLQSELNAVQGTSIKGITKDELLTKVLMIPCYEEQDKIGRYLHFIDNLITLHQRKLEVLKKLKKGLLQQMFV